MRYHHSMPPFSFQVAREFISAPRLEPYLQEVGYENEELALELYHWSTELEGAFHATLSFVEITLRNAIDRELKRWNSEVSSSEWTRHGVTRSQVREIAGKAIKLARDYAQKELDRKSENQNITPHHDQIIAQLTFGNLTFFFKDPGKTASKERENIRDEIWEKSLKNAFPDLNRAAGSRICEIEDGRQKLGRSLEHLRRLRNRVAHHDNLLKVKIRDEINVINSVLSKMHPDLPGFAMYKSQLRRLRREDPRRYI